MKEYKCEICSQTGARFRSYKKVLGLVLISRVSYTKPRALCEKHKVSEGAKANLANFFLGWWGITAFIWNIMAIISNFTGGKDVTETVESAYANYVKGVAEAMDKQKVLG
ncbi:MAG: hypothetical protein PHS44_01660 [Candidatus Dojkabacteria bacterium]|jgi:hypothetical protein|nr:hypothetical protein [Candidatus Dojkabacteria bacterium]